MGVHEIIRIMFIGYGLLVLRAEHSFNLRY